MSNEFLPSFPCLLEVSVVGMVKCRSGQSVLYVGTSILFIEMQQKKKQKKQKTKNKKTEKKKTKLTLSKYTELMFDRYGGDCANCAKNCG